MNQNQDLRLKAAGSGVRLWQVADAIGLSPSGFSTKLRKELPAEEKAKIFEIIDRLAQEGN